MTENDYRSLVLLSFGSDIFIKEITENLAFYYPITTQECMLSVSCEKTSSKVSKNSSNSLKNSSSTPKSKSNECVSSVECDKSPSNVSSNLKKTFLQLQNRNQMNVLRH